MLRSTVVHQSLNGPRSKIQEFVETSSDEVNLDDNFAYAVLQSSYPVTPTLYHERQPATTVGPRVPPYSQCGCTNSHLDLLQSLYPRCVSPLLGGKNLRQGKSISDGHVKDFGPQSTYFIVA